MNKIAPILLASFLLTGCASFYNVRVGESAKQSYYQTAAIVDVLSKQNDKPGSPSESLKQLDPYTKSMASQISEMNFSVSDSFSLKKGISLEETEHSIGKADSVECNGSKNKCTAVYYKGHMKLHYVGNRLSDFEATDSINGDFLPISIETSRFAAGSQRKAE